MGTSAGTVFMLSQWASNSHTNTVKSIIEADPDVDNQSDSASQPSCFMRIRLFVEDCLGKNDPYKSQKITTDSQDKNLLNEV